MADWLSAEWAEQAAALCRFLPDAPGATGTVNWTFAVAPRREVGFHWRYEHGKVTEAGSGPAAEADLTLTAAAADAADLVAGRVEPSVAFMRGRLKAAGDGGLMLAVLESTTSTGFGAWRESVATLAPVP